jgi:protein involved in polysaccharide export with SLBB domain
MRRAASLLGLGLCAALLAAGCTPLHGGVRDMPVDKRVNPIATPRAGVDLAEAAPSTVPPSPAAAPDPLPRWAATPPLSPGDRLQVDVEDGDGFSGRYEVEMDGTLRLPHLPPVPVAGGGTDEAARRIAAALVEAEYFKPHRVRVSVLVHEWSHVQVHVGGAVFDPGMVSVNVRSPEERALKSDLAAGDFPSERMLAAALRSAGGVRPDAALDRIQLIRDGRTLTVSHAGLLQGHPIVGVPLMSGDRILVASTGHFDPALVAPSAITPPGIRVFLSNLTVPATGNAVSAVGKEASSLPYGSRLLTAAFSANCVGGINSTSAARHAVLVRTDPLSGRQETVERQIHALLEAPHRDDLNPLVMPNDAVSCYDSGVTNVRDIARTLYEILLPLSLL